MASSPSALVKHKVVSLLASGNKEFFVSCEALVSCETLAQASFLVVGFFIEFCKHGPDIPSHSYALVEPLLQAVSKRTGGISEVLKLSEHFPSVYQWMKLHLPL